MLDMLTKGPDILFQPFYYFGVVVWNVVMGLVGVTSVQTPITFSHATWNFVCNDLYPWMSAIGAIMLNIFFYIGYVRQAGNLRQNMTLEIFVETCIKVVLGNILLVNGLMFMRLFFNIAGGMTAGLQLEFPIIQTVEDSDVGSALFYGFFGIIFVIVCLVCSAMIFLTVYGRYLNLYLLAATAPIALGTLPGGPGVSQTFYAWLRTFLAKVFVIFLIILALVLAAKMSNSINFNGMEEVAGVFAGAVHALQNIFTMVLVTAAVKGMDSLMKQAFAL